MKRIFTLVDWASAAAALIGAVLCLMMAFLITYEVVTRSVFNASTSFATELSVYFTVAIAFLGAAYCVREDHHVRVDVLIGALPSRARAIVDIVSCLVALLFAWILFVEGWETVLRSHSSGILSSGVLRVPLYIPQAAVPIGGMALCLQLGVRIVRDVARVKTPEDDSLTDWSAQETKVWSE